MQTHGLEKKNIHKFEKCLTIPPWRVVDIDNVIESEQRWHLKNLFY